MFGQEWLALQESPIFVKATMDKIFEEVLTNEGTDPLKFTNAFLPQRNFDSEDLIALVKNAINGKTAPYSLGGNIPLTTIPGFRYKSYGITRWREGIYWSEKEMQLLKKPARPLEPAGSDLMVMSNETLAKRMNNRIEFLSSQTVLAGGYDVGENGINYRYLSGIPAARHYLRLGNTAHSSTVGVVYSRVSWWTDADDADLWSATATSHPLLDITKVCQWATLRGMVVEEIWMTPGVSSLVQESADTLAWLARNMNLVRDYITTPDVLLLLPSLKGIRVVVDERRYTDETFLTATASTGSAVLTCENGLITRDGGQTLTLISPDGQFIADVLTHATTDPTATTITLTANASRAWERGTRVVASKPYLADIYGVEHYVVFKTKMAPNCGNFAFTPSIVAGTWDQPRSGKFTWVDFSQEKGRPWIMIGAGFEGGPVVWEGGGYIVLHVQ